MAKTTTEYRTIVVSQLDETGHVIRERHYLVHREKVVSTLQALALAYDPDRAIFSELDPLDAWAKRA